MNPSLLDCVRFMESRPIPERPRYAITPAERSCLRASGLISEPVRVAYNFDTLKQRNRALARDNEPKLLAAFEQVKARWGIRDLPWGEVIRAARRFGCDPQVLRNKFYKARLAEDLANGLAPRERGRAA